METLLQDLRYGIRLLARAPGFAAVAIFTLALGIGAATSIFSVADAVLLRPLPYASPRQIVRVWEQAPDGRRMNLADPNFEDFHEQNATFAALAEYAALMSPVAGGSEPVRLTIAEVTGEFFDALGVQPLRGRAFAPEERLHGAPAAIVSYGYWQQYLGGGADLSGFQLRTEGAVFPVIGVMPQGFDFPPGAAVWIPRRSGTDSSRTGHNWRGLGRVRDGITVAQARANLGAIAQGIKERWGKDADLYSAAVVPLAEALVGDVRSALLTLLGAVGLLLLVACANVAGLLLARTSSRRKELAVRAALGAGRGRLIRQFLAESLSLSLAGGALGVLIAAWSVKALPAVLPANLPRQQEIAINAPVLLFALAATIAVAVSLGLFAAWRAHGDLQQALSSNTRGNSASATSHQLRGMVVTGEIAATLVILASAGLLGRSFLRLIATNPGFSPQSLITLEFSLPAHQWHTATDQSAIARQIHFMDDLLTRLRAIPGVRSAGLAGAMPVAGGDDLADGDFLILNGRKPPADIGEFGQMAHDRSQAGHALFCVAGEAYFRTLGIPLISGRMFDAQADESALHVALISETLARQRWPNQDPIGQVIDFGNMDGNLRPLTIAGVVGDVRARGLDLPPSPIIYVDYRQRGMYANSSPTVVMRSAVPPGDIISAARNVFRGLAPDEPVKFSTFQDEMGGWLADRRFVLFLVGLFAAAALALAAVGIYGVVAFSVARRSQEIGIRVALGAQRADVLRLVVGEGARLAVLGVGIGVCGSLLVTRLMATLLFGVSPTDPLTFAGVALLVWLVALAASYIPARRAMRVDPAAALRYE